MVGRVMTLRPREEWVLILKPEGATAVTERRIEPADLQRC
jgi:hypothetical protein